MYWYQLEFEERHTDEYKQAINNSGDIGGTNLSRWGTELETFYCKHTYTHTCTHLLIHVYICM